MCAYPPPSEIKQRLAAIILPYLDAAVTNAVHPALTGQEHLRRDLKLDSADVMEIVLDVEEAFGISIENAHFHRLVIVDDLFLLVRSKLGVAP